MQLADGDFKINYSAGAVISLQYSFMCHAVPRKHTKILFGSTQNETSWIHKLKWQRLVVRCADASATLGSTRGHTTSLACSHARASAERDR